MKRVVSRVGLGDPIRQGSGGRARTLRPPRDQVAPPVYAARMRTPFAVLGIRTVGTLVTGIEYLPLGERGLAPTDALAERACRQLERYLVDAQFRFSLPLARRGTAFRQRVWEALAQIPIGESRTYGEIARELRSAPRAIGGACGA